MMSLLSSRVFYKEPVCDVIQLISQAEKSAVHLCQWCCVCIKNGLVTNHVDGADANTDISKYHIKT